MVSKEGRHIGSVMRISAEDALISRLNKKSVFESIEMVIKNPEKRQKLQGTLELLAHIFPQKAVEYFCGISQSYKNTKNLPFSDDDLCFKKKVNHGFASEVFLLESQNKSIDSFALKVNYMEHGTPTELAERANDQRQEYERIKELYKESPNVIPWQASLIIESPRTKRPAIATLQEFQSGKMRDLFDDFSPTELISELKNDAQLQSDFLSFSATTLSVWKDEGISVDLLGKENLIIVQSEQCSHLKFLDPHDMINDGDANGDRQERIEERLAYLESIKSYFENGKDNHNQ